MAIELPIDEFNILRQDEQEIHIYDKLVDKVYIFIKAERKWIFPAGSRQEVIMRLTGFDAW